MLDQLRAMAVFAKAVETGSFRAAAKALGLSPSVVSHHVAQLEARLDVVLLYRSTRRLRLTDDGARLFEAAREMLSAAEGGLESLGARGKNPAGRLTIAAPAAFTHGRFLDDVSAFARAFPRVSLSAHFSDAPVDLLGEGIDVAIRGGTLADSNLKSKRLFVLARRVVAARSYAATRAAPTRPQDLANWDWIRLKSRPSEITFIGPDGSRLSVEFAARIATDSAEAMRQLALRGLGLAALPLDMVNRDLDAGRLVEPVPDWKLEAPPVYAVWHANAPRSGLAVRFISFLEDRVRARR